MQRELRRNVPPNAYSLIRLAGPDGLAALRSALQDLRNYAVRAHFDSRVGAYIVSPMSQREYMSWRSGSISAYPGMLSLGLREEAVDGKTLLGWLREGSHDLVFITVIDGGTKKGFVRVYRSSSSY